MPYEATIFGRIGATLDDSVDGAPLVLSQHGFLRLAVLNIEQNPMLERAQEIGALEEGLHCEAISLVRPLLPARQELAGWAPRAALPKSWHGCEVGKMPRSHQFSGRRVITGAVFFSAPHVGAVLFVLFVAT